jgi:UDP-N-acetylmuramate dehydrogenase
MLFKEISYYKTGGSAEKIYSPADLGDLSQVMKDIQSDNVPYFILGAGSNSLVMDEFWPGAVVLCNNLSAVEVRQSKIIVQAGVENTAFVKTCLESELKGASWMNGLPGQVGSTVRMNARCYGGEISRIVESVTAVTRQGEIKTYAGSGVFFGYKDTVFMKNRDVVAEVTFTLGKGNPADIQKHMEFCKKDRDNKHQFLFPSCGCVFKNDYNVGVPSGMLLESAGVRQLGTDGVEISPYHANFVFNKGAGASDILGVVLDMRDLTYEKFGVWLELEMEVLGVIPEDLKKRLYTTKPSRLNIKELEPLKQRFQG